MADSGLGSIVKWGLIAGVAYYLYETFMVPAVAQPVASTVPLATGSITLPNLQSALTINPNPPLSPDTGLTDWAAELNSAAAPDANLVNGKMSAWQWNYYLNILRPAGVPAAQFGAAFPNAANLITAADFVAALKAQPGGLAGLGAPAVKIPVPVSMTLKNGKRAVVWAAPGGDGTVKVFGAAHPFTVGVRRLPA
jgi:hypothetical protein